MSIVVFDTETTGLQKPFCYNIGYAIVETENWEILCKRDFVVEQIWHNLPLFSTAYYAEKRPIYVQAMRRHEMIMDKFGYICQQMKRDFKTYNVEHAFAFNSPFDTKVFDYNCDWFKCNNPFEATPIHDIRGYAHHFLTNKAYKDFCDEHSLYTETGNYSTTAEAYFKYYSAQTDFVEAHTALADSEIETYILKCAVAMGAELGMDYEPFRSIEKPVEKTLEIVDIEKNHHYFSYKRFTMNKEKTKITLK